MKKGNKRLKLSLLQKIMKCLSSSEQLNTNNIIRANDESAGGISSLNGDSELYVDMGNIEEAEYSLREGGCLNDEEARALLGRLEYQRGNTEAALRVFDGIDFSSVTPKIKMSIARRATPGANSYSSSLMSMHAISLLLEAIFLKSKSLQNLGRFKEAAISCNIILDTVESALPNGLQGISSVDSKLREMTGRAVELLPELWKQAGLFHEAISTYRRALLYQWNLDSETTMRIQKDFAVFLLYCGSDSNPPNLLCQLEGSFIPQSNVEEAILLLMILLRKITMKNAKWDPSIIDHLSYALSVSGNLKTLARQFEGLLPGVIAKNERYYTLALCYTGEGDDASALNLLKKIFSARENSNSLKALLLASKICSEDKLHAKEGVSFARQALSNLTSRCDTIGSVANCLLGISLSTEGRFSPSDSERISKQAESLITLEKAGKLVNNKNLDILFNLSLENAEQRKLDAALYYAKLLLKHEAGSVVKSWILFAKILSAQKRFIDAENIINAALEQMEKWDQGDLLRLKAKIQIAQGLPKHAIETYTRILAILQLKAKSFGVGEKHMKNGEYSRSLETETWRDLANLYTSMSRWNDAEVCLSKAKIIDSFSASQWHAEGKLYEAKGLKKEALEAYRSALEIEATHIPSLVSTSVVLKHLGYQPLAFVKCFLTDALRVDRTNHDAWYHLGLLHNSENGRSSMEAAECFQAAALLQESAPLEPFR